MTRGGFRRAGRRSRHHHCGGRRRCCFPWRAGRCPGRPQRQWSNRCGGRHRRLPGQWRRGCGRGAAFAAPRCGQGVLDCDGHLSPERETGRVWTGRHVPREEAWVVGYGAKETTPAVILQDGSGARDYRGHGPDWRVGLRSSKPGPSEEGLHLLTGA